MSKLALMKGNRARSSAGWVHLLGGLVGSAALFVTSSDLAHAQTPTPAAVQDPPVVEPPADKSPTTAATPLARRGVTVLEDLRYKPGEGKAGLCDVYMPTTGPPGAGFPVVLVIHGGGWMSGDKWTMAGYCQNLAREGYVAVDINYRLAPAFKFPAQADDVRDALLWLVDQQEQLQLDLQRVGLFGYSAGGHLAALIGLSSDAAPQQRQTISDWPAGDPRWDRLPKIDAICIGGPPCDFRLLPQDNTTLAYFLGGSRRELPEIYQAASPTVHVSAEDPPIQIIHGEKDIIVPIADSQAMHEALRQAGVDSRFETIDGQGHLITFLHPKTNQTVLEFFRDTLGKKPDVADADSDGNDRSPISAPASPPHEHPR